MSICDIVLSVIVKEYAYFEEIVEVMFGILNMPGVIWYSNIVGGHVRFVAGKMNQLEH